MLLGASLLFYSLWIPSYLVLLLIEIGVNYLLLRGMRHSTRPKLYLAASIVFTLGVLVWFKYAALLVETALPFLSGLGADIAIPDIFLPLGISFYSFQIIALAVDSHRKPESPLPSLARYALFVSFFPQLIAGPILRGHHFLPQLELGGRPTSRRTRRGLWLIGAGLAKKVVLADFLLAPFVDEVFGAPGVASAPYHWIAIYSFSFQIYFDFSGYTDMARGLALLLGFELPANFREPYLARNPAEFWRSWHITLSQWLRDYLYIPLGGNRRGSARTYVNLGLTMLLGGLWHGASFTFVVWGGLARIAPGHPSPLGSAAAARTRRFAPLARRAADRGVLSRGLLAVGLLSSRQPARCGALPARPFLWRRIALRLADPAGRCRVALHGPSPARTGCPKIPAKAAQDGGSRSVARGAGRPPPRVQCSH